MTCIKIWSCKSERLLIIYYQWANNFGVSIFFLLRFHLEGCGETSSHITELFSACSIVDNPLLITNKALTLLFHQRSLFPKLSILLFFWGFFLPGIRGEKLHLKIPLQKHFRHLKWVLYFVSLYHSTLNNCHLSKGLISIYSMGCSVSVSSCTAHPLSHYEEKPWTVSLCWVYEACVPPETKGPSVAEKATVLCHHSAELQTEWVPSRSCCDW